LNEESSTLDTIQNQTTPPVQETMVHDDFVSEGEPMEDLNMHREDARPRRMRKPTCKLLNDESRHLTRLRQAVGYIVNSLVGYSLAGQFYTDIKTTIKEEIKNHEQEFAMMHETVELNDASKC